MDLVTPEFWSRHNRILASNRGEAGVAVTRPTGSQLLEELPGDRLTFEEKRTGQERDASIDEAQQIALVTGSFRYIGQRPKIS